MLDYGSQATSNFQHVLDSSPSGQQSCAHGDKLDEYFSTHLLEFNNLEILKGFEEDSSEPNFRKPENKITLRYLLTHSGGRAYDVFSPC